MPSFLHGTFMNVARRTSREGQRCGEQYRKDGTFPPPLGLLEIPAREVVIAHELVDFQHEQPTWRLYLFSRVISSLCEALDWQNSFQVDDEFEAFCRETPWGALYFTLSQKAPLSAERMSLRLQAVLRSWEPLQSARYLFKKLDAVLSLEDLLLESSDWVMDAWCPKDDGSVRTRLELAADRMSRATREDCIEAILRQMPRALEFVRGLKHRDLLADPSFQRQRLTLLTPEAFERLSAACTSDLLGQVYAWDRQLAQQ
ncbi:hypothetical protein [Hyalangium gracile]|uniref:hypothetical protein n=1 Tax=Hyalangium gracile TaxID=394092 RepID=UPI001CCE3B8C|nr:hypothetical protein [Hyalangium gracile]